MGVAFSLTRSQPVGLRALRPATDLPTCHPSLLAAGTKMVFAGLKKEDDRRDLIAYLKQSTA
jgi:hypothetical protein